MCPAIVQSDEPVTLLGAGNASSALLAESMRRAPVLVAADGGARFALSQDLIPDAVIGDLDSLDAPTVAQIPAERLHRIEEQDSTDFEKALREIRAPLVLAVGFTGSRLDHELAVYNALVRCADRRTIVLGDTDLCLHCPRELNLTLTPGTRLSLFPLAGMECPSSGLEWDTTGLHMSPSGRVGTSNRTADPQVSLRPEAEGMLLILPRETLDQVMQALAG